MCSRQSKKYECKSMYVPQSKNRTMINVNVNAENQLTGVLMKKITCVFLVHVIVSIIRSVELVNI